MNLTLLNINIEERNNQLLSHFSINKVLKDYQIVMLLKIYYIKITGNINHAISIQK